MTVLAQKWRPKTFDQVVDQPHVVQALKNALKQNYLHHAYLFTGTRGIGKTTLARILAKALNCEKGITDQPCGECAACREIDAGHFIDLLEVDAASRTKVEDTRELLDNVQYAPVKGRFKVYIIDEVHMLSGHSFNALLKTLEEPPPHVKFLLATTDPQKLPATVLSRCLQFHLTLITAEQIAQHCEYILKAEKINYEPEALKLIANAAEGSMRDALSLLDQAIGYGDGKVILNDMKAMLGTIESDLIEQILQACKDQDANTLLMLAKTLNQQGANFVRALDELITLLHQIAVAQLTQTYANGKIENFSHLFSPEAIQLLYQIALMGKRDLPLAPSPQLGFEMTLLRLLAFEPEKEMVEKKVEPKINPIKNTETKNPIQKNSTAKNTTVKNSKSKDWAALLSALKLTGIAQTLAQHCELKSFENDCVYLELESRQEPLLQAHYIDRIKTALKEYYQRYIAVEISLASQTLNNTPHLQAQRLASERYQLAEKNLSQDFRLQTLAKNFDAQILKGTIEPCET